MTFGKTLVAALCSLALVGCAVDMGTSDRGLDTRDNEDGRAVKCPVTAFNLLDRDAWVVDGITVGGVYYTRDQLVDEAEQSPNDPYTDLKLHVAAVINNAAVGLELPDDIIDALTTAEVILASADAVDRNQRQPPPVISTELVDTLDSFNTDAAVYCLDGNTEAAVVDEPLPGDRREGIFHREF